MDATPAERTPSDGIVDLAALAGLFGIVVGTVILAPTDLGFDRVAAVAALLAWIPVTLPAGLVIVTAAAVDIGAGVVLARFIHGRPFDRIDEALLQGFVLAVIKDIVLLGLLAGFGLFTQPILIAVHVVVLALGAARLRPVVAMTAVPRIGPVTPFGVLLLVAWSAPILLQLASPIVPFLDVLPNHVAPAEHLRTFGALGSLTDTQSPIYGPSRIFLGYTVLLGTITTGSGLPAGEALAGFILPSTILVAVAIHRLARALGGPEITRWALLVFAMTTSFARLGDARATVVVLPLAAWVLATVADRISGHRAEAEAEGEAEGDPGAWRIGRRLRSAPILLGLGLGAAVLLHPVIGFLTAMTLVIVVLARPLEAGPLAIPALGVGTIVALPQLATAVGLPLPPIALIVALAGGVFAGVVLVAASAWHGPLVRFGRLLVGMIGLGAIVIAGPLVRAAVDGTGPIPSVMELSVLAGVAAVALRAPAARNPVLWAAMAAGFGVAMLTQLVPEEGAGLLGDALRFELPKTLHYWVPVIVAVLAASGIAAVLRKETIPSMVRGVSVVVFVVTAALPIRTAPIDAFHLGEHRLSETLSIAMRWVQTGFWSGFPDSRYVVDGPRREILAAVRAEIEAGRIGPDTPVLHVAGSFQQWRATPLGVFTGVTETDVTPDAVVSIHTAGGRLRPMGDLPSLLAQGAYPYVLFEPSPDNLPPEVRAMIVAAGYQPVFSNGQGELFVLQAPIDASVIDAPRSPVR